jgi:cation transporter-like permease
VKWWRGAGTALLHVLYIVLIPVLMLAGGYVAAIVGGHLAEPDYQSAAERAARPPGDDPNYFVAHLLGAVVGFLATGLLLVLVYGVWAARRERQPEAARR